MNHGVHALTTRCNIPWLHRGMMAQYSGPDPWSHRTTNTSRGSVAPGVNVVTSCYRSCRHTGRHTCCNKPRERERKRGEREREA
eukprot:12404674-Alexandrium_andersonii.AAC.1